MQLTVIRLNHVDPRKSLLQCAYGHLTDARDSRSTVKYRAHHVRLQVFTPRNHDSRRKMKLVGLHINPALVHACDCIHSVRQKNGGRDVPAAPSSDGFASAFGALTALPDDDAAAPPSTAGESSTGTHKLAPRRWTCCFRPRSTRWCIRRRRFRRHRSDLHRASSSLPRVVC